MLLHLMQAQMVSSLGWLINLVIILVVVGAVLYIAQTVLALPPQITNIIYIVFVVAVAIVALKFLAGLV